MAVRAFFFFVFFAVLLALSQVESSSAAQLKNLPGYIGPKLNMYTGYITVNETHGRNLFYWLIESQNKPSTDPLVLWLNGGPGCSSLGGLFTENGPLVPLANGSIGYNSLGWTQYANMLYLEAPAGVGFSYSNDSLDYFTNDEKTSLDNYNFLQGFLQEYPQYQGREFWITGESYAGVYIPTLAERILNDSSTQLYQMLKGLMAGNPVFNCPTAQESDNTIQLNLLYWHGLVSYTNFAKWKAAGCDGKKIPNVECLNIYGKAVNEIGIIYQELQDNSLALHEPSLDPDDLYQDFCTGNGTLSFSLDDPETCQNTNSGSLLVTYLNRADVQQAIGARPTKWAVCSDKIIYVPSGASMVPLYEDFFNQKPGISILVYSGDVDIMTVPFAITQPCLAEMNRKELTKWSPWYVNGWTAGYWQQFDTYTYATLKGAGHEAPGYQPLNALNMFSRFLLNQNLQDPATGRGADGRYVDDEAVLRRLAWKKKFLDTRPLRQGDMLRLYYGARP